MPDRTKRKPRRRLSRAQERRRSFLRAALVAGACLALQPLAFLPMARRWQARLRPPGALPEERLLAACIKCGQCVQVCPVEAIHLADVADGLGVGIPFIDARKQACDFSCDALSCILACPTGALSHDLAAKEEVQAGLARLVRPDACLARQGKGFSGKVRDDAFQGRLRYESVDRWNPIPVRDHPYELELCDLCVRECPIGDSAIRMQPVSESKGVVRMTPVIHSGCVGCGVCEMICPQEPTCIEVEPRVTWRSA
jgi:ferredoxin-type protein NapG